MFEYHGWITVWEGSNEAEDSSVLLELNCQEIKATIDVNRNENSRVELYYQNGSPYVRFDGSRNHYNSYALDLFVHIGKIAKGSYGLLYIRDDENPEYENELQVWRMARGEVTQMKDTLLSPCDPIIETYG